MATQYSPRGSTASEIAAHIEDAVRTGRLPPGDRLPPVRAMAADLGVSPGTVAAAVATLRSRGVVTTNGRRGTRVGRRPPIAAAPVRVTGRTLPPGLRDLSFGSPDPRLLPDLGSPMARQTRRTRNYAEAAVDPALDVAAARWLARDGIDTSALTVVSGAMDAVERVLTAWLAPGDRVVVEDPGYPPVLDVVAALGLVAVPVPVDDEGLEPAAFRQALAGAVSAVVVTPRAQNPTGAALSPARASQLRTALDARRDVLVIEDDHAGPVAGVPARSLAAGGSLERWAVARSVSKALGPDLRCAVVAGDPTTVSRVEGRLALGPGWVSGLLQGAVADLLGRSGTAALLDRASRTYARRRDALLRALARRDVDGARGASGLNVWIPVADEPGALAHLWSDGIAVAAGSRFRTHSPPGVRVTIAALDVADAPSVADAIARAVHAVPLRTG